MLTPVCLCLAQPVGGHSTARFKLLFGPYRSPPLKPGDRTHSNLLVSLVFITSLSSASIPWPRCRSLKSTGGGSGLLVDEELARAVRHESAAAVMHWWGASVGAVCRWRNALGVNRTDNEGTARLMHAAAEKGAEAVKERLWTEEERECCRQVNAEKGLAANLVTGYHGPLWRPEDIALLVRLPNEEPARVKPITSHSGEGGGRPATAGEAFRGDRHPLQRGHPRGQGPGVL